MRLYRWILNWLFPVEQPVMHPMEFDAGFSARIEGLELEANRNEPGTAEAQAWAAGWEDADAWVRGQL